MFLSVWGSSFKVQSLLSDSLQYLTHFLFFQEQSTLNCRDLPWSIFLNDRLQQYIQSNLFYVRDLCHWFRILVQFLKAKIRAHIACLAESSSCYSTIVTCNLEFRSMMDSHKNQNVPFSYRWTGRGGGRNFSLEMSKTVIVQMHRHEPLLPGFSRSRTSRSEIWVRD